MASDESLTAIQTQAKKMPLEWFIFNSCEHHAYYKERGCSCPICVNDLIKWVDMETGLLEFKYLDGRGAEALRRSNTVEDMSLFEYYEQTAARQTSSCTPKKGSSKKNFKAAVNKCCRKSYSILEIVENNKEHVKQYRFLKTREEIQNLFNGASIYYDETSIEAMTSSSGNVESQVFQNNDSAQDMAMEVQRGQQVSVTNGVLHPRIGMSFPPHPVHLTSTQNVSHDSNYEMPAQLPHQNLQHVSNGANELPIISGTMLGDNNFDATYGPNNSSANTIPDNVNLGPNGSSVYAIPNNSNMITGATGSNVTFDSHTMGINSTNTMHYTREWINSTSEGHGHLNIIAEQSRADEDFTGETWNDLLRSNLKQQYQQRKLHENANLLLRFNQEKSLLITFHGRPGRIDQTPMLTEQIDGTEFGGFRILPWCDSRNLPIETSNTQQFGPTTEDGKPIKPLSLYFDHAYDCGNDNVKKVMESFQSGGLFFWWQDYTPPEDLIQCWFVPELAQRLCTRLMCRRLCRGYPKDPTSDSSRLQVLPICFKSPFMTIDTPLVMSKNPVDVEVLDLFKTFMNLIDAMDNHVGAASTLQKQCRLYFGLKATLKSDSPNHHMRFEIRNLFIEHILCQNQLRGIDDGISTVTGNLEALSISQS